MIRLLLASLNTENVGDPPDRQPPSEDGSRLERYLVLVEGAALLDEPDLGPEPREDVLLVGGVALGGVGRVAVVEVVVGRVHDEGEALEAARELLLGAHDVGGGVETLRDRDYLTLFSLFPKLPKCCSYSQYTLFRGE